MKTTKEKLGQEPAFPAEPIDVVVGQVTYNYIDENGLEQINRSNQYGQKLQHGMSKRFYAACCAMQGYIAGVRGSGDAVDIKEMVEVSYVIADELLKAENL